MKLNWVGSSERWFVFQILWRQECDQSGGGGGGHCSWRLSSQARCSQFHLSPLMVRCPGLALASLLLPLVSTTPYSYIQVNTEQHQSRFFKEYLEMFSKRMIIVFFGGDFLHEYRKPESWPFPNDNIVFPRSLETWRSLKLVSTWQSGGGGLAEVKLLSLK